MGDTDIGWTHRPGTIGRTWNPTRGCFPVSPGCANCYACKQGARFSGSGKPFAGFIKLTKNGPPKWTGKGEVIEHKLDEPFSWTEPSTVFVNSMSDLFFDAFSFEEIASVYAVMALTPRHTYQILTKRPERALEFFAWLGSGETSLYEKINAAFDKYIKPNRSERYWYQTLGIDPYAPVFHENVTSMEWPLPNVWQGVSAENQECYDQRLPALLEIPAAVKFLSLEPLLGPIDLDIGMCEQCMGTTQSIAHWEDEDGKHSSQPTCADCGGDADDSIEMSYGWWNNLGSLSEGVRWVIVGAESGPGSRPCEDQWVRDIVKQCKDAGVAVFVKQLVEQSETAKQAWLPGASFGKGSERKNRGYGGRIVTAPYLDGMQYVEFPDLTDLDDEHAA